MTRKPRFKFLLPLGLWLAALAVGADFSPPQEITAADPAAPYGLSRSTAGSLVATASDRLALIYFDGGQEFSALSPPSRVWLREWSAASGWGAPLTLVDHATGFGGRHPALLAHPDGSLLAFWHDYRHADSSQKFNIEIYGNRRPAGGAFAATDTRLTHSEALHGGDNGYTPQATLLPNGRVALTWYDFHWNPNISEICLRLGEPGGWFGPAPAMDTLRLTSGSDRIGVIADSSFTVPAIAAAADGSIHLAWATGTGGASQLNYGRRDTATGAWLEKTVLETSAGGYYDPARLLATAAGPVWLVTSRDMGGGNFDIHARRRTPADAAFGPAMPLETEPGIQQQPAIAADAQGRLHLAWVDRRPPRRVHYRVFDAAGQPLAPPLTLTTRDGDWQRPALALSPLGAVHVVWEEELTDGNGRLWFTHAPPPRSGAAQWRGYR